jgi:tRNA (uracil-5-)-methyltransferase
MTCKHFGEINYTEQLKRKEERVSGLLAPFYSEKLEVFDSPSDHYRARSEFRIWHEGDRCDYAMGKMQIDGVEKKGAINIEECPKVIAPIEKRMWKLLEKINASTEVLKHRLFAVEFLATTTDECLITMLYHRKLDDVWSEKAKELETLLDCKIMGRSRKQKVILSDEFVTEKLDIDGETFTYVQYESGFTQPNPTVNVELLWTGKFHLTTFSLFR